VNEMWRAIPRYVGRYEASNLGRVRSLVKPGGRRCVQRDEPHVLKQATLTNGYQGVTLSDGNGYYRTEAVHVLVLETFVGDRPSVTHDGAHTDGDRSNNALENLSWKTKSENERDKVRHGTHARGERDANARLTETDVLAIRRRHAAGESGRDLATAFGVTATQISRIVLRQSWNHVPPEAGVTPRAAHSKPTGYSSWRNR
jgi:hypothetical protein